MNVTSHGKEMEGRKNKYLFNIGAYMNKWATNKNISVTVLISATGHVALPIMNLYLPLSATYTVFFSSESTTTGLNSFPEQVTHIITLSLKGLGH